jgi:hypothetical protein
MMVNFSAIAKIAKLIVARKIMEINSYDSDFLHEYRRRHYKGFDSRSDDLIDFKSTAGQKLGLRNALLFGSFCGDRPSKCSPSVCLD